MLSCCSEGLALTGYYLVSIAFGLFFQPAIVHAAEASLSQLLNLLLAFALFRCLRVGRSSAVGFMRAKILSFVMVTLGLVLCTLEDPDPNPNPNPLTIAVNDGIVLQPRR